MSTNKVAERLSWLVALIIALIPFHAFLTVWFSSVLGHYTAIRLWKEYLLLALVLGSSYLLYKDRKLRKSFFSSRLSLLIIVYSLVSLVWGVGAYALDKVTLKALGYGLIVNLRFLVFFLAVWLIASLAPKLKQLWPKLLFIPAGIAIFIGLLQRLAVPYDVLKHFGYSESTIYPYETINHNINYPRVMSTLRGANPLGAYLVVVLTGFCCFFTKFRDRWLRAFLVAGGFVVLFLSYSRGAWIGMALSLATLGILKLKNNRPKKLLVLTIAGLLMITPSVALRHTSTFQNYVFHTEDRSSIAESSNEGHVSAFRNGVHDLVHAPLGRGVGTAGPASLYNHDKVRISENYYIQLAQEIGWLGLALFLAINFLVAKELWLRRNDTLAMALFASFVGLIFVNLVSHAWTDDTLAYLWWGLAGIALAPILKHKHHHE